eukprot:5976788-Prymnesium_polylepis.1
MGEAIKEPITAELTTALQKLAVANGAAPVAVFQPVAAPAAARPEASVLEILISLPPSVFKTVNLSMDASYWDWHGKPPPQPRFSGKPTSWACQEKGQEQPRIKWELGRDDQGNPQLDGHNQLKYAQTAPALMSKLMQHGLRLEPFDNGAAAPTLSAVAAPTESDTHLLSSSDLTDFNMLLARARAVVSPAAKYFETSMEGKRGAQLARMKAARIFNPLHIMANGAVTEADIDGLSLFRFSKHPNLAPKIQEMKGEIVKYNSL